MGTVRGQLRERKYRKVEDNPKFQKALRELKKKFTNEQSYCGLTDDKWGNSSCSICGVRLHSRYTFPMGCNTEEQRIQFIEKLNGENKGKVVALTPMRNKRRQHEKR